MDSFSHQGKIKKTVTIVFGNGYSLTLEADQEIAIMVVVEEQKAEAENG